MKAATKFAAVLAVAALGVTGCGSDDSDESSASSGGGEKAATVKIPTIIDQTGVAGFFAKNVQKGMELAISEANEADALKGTKISLDVKDSASEPKQAVTLLSSIVKDDPPAVLFGTQGGSALAMAPIAQRAGTPLVIAIAGTPGVVETGDHIFRATAPQSTYHGKQAAHLAAEGAKRIAVMFASDSASLADLAKKTYPALAKEHGLEIVNSTGVASTDTELSSVVSKVQGSKPDAVVMLLIGKQNVSVAKSLRGSGFDGIIASQYGIGSEALKALGSDAEGIVFPSDFTPGMDAPSTQAFVKAFTAKYGSEPDSFNANGYVAAQLLVKGLQNAGDDLGQEAVLAGLTKATDSGFDSATGPIRFEDRDARVEGVLVKWQDGKETVLATP
jgi:branched-chain amino acid transport system substrate-binding protein